MSRACLRGIALLLGLSLWACGTEPGRAAGTPAGRSDGAVEDSKQQDAAAADRTGDFATSVVSFKPGAGAGFGQDNMPAVVLGRPEGKGPQAGSLDVVSLGCTGSIVLSFAPKTLINGPGADLLVFENPFPNWTELGRVAVSEDGVTWHTWPCDPEDKAGGYPGCAGVNPVLANSDNGVDPTDPQAAGGDAFDLADLGLTRAKFVRITDAATHTCDPPAAGFDLDAVALIHSASLQP